MSARLLVELDYIFTRFIPRISRVVSGEPISSFSILRIPAFSFYFVRSRYQMGPHLLAIEDREADARWARQPAELLDPAGSGQGFPALSFCYTKRKRIIE